MSNTTWRELITGELKRQGESFDDIIKITLTDEQLDVVFDAGYGGIEGLPFTAWTKDRVYFPRCYDGSEDAASVPRHPSGEAVEHIGGG